jgi:uncharacterized FAD-dependent dehydrogenase
VGFRIEHPQDIINKIQFGDFGLLCQKGEGKVPVLFFYFDKSV